VNKAITIDPFDPLSRFTGAVRLPARQDIATAAGRERRRQRDELPV
jgi:hypothetical protein